MDKYEYKLRLQEIKNLIKEREFVKAAAIADTIDWTRVKSVMVLCTISDLYKINRRLEDSRDLLLLAYDRYPGGRSIVYSLCELSIKMDDVVQAVEYYKEFVQIAPKDTGRYILQYKLYEAQEVSLEERIEVLEELKSRDYTEKWAYELAYLYHRIGLGTKCVEECDELILMFGEGRYVMKAMELKRLHEPLTQAQEEKYEQMKNPAPIVEEPAEETSEESSEESGEEVVEEGGSDAVEEEKTGNKANSDDMDIQVQVMGVGQYDTINIQRELAENMKEIWEENADHAPDPDNTGKTKRIILSGKPDTTMDLSATKVLDKIEDLQDTGAFEVSVQKIVEDKEPVKTEEPKKEVFFGETEDLGITRLLSPVDEVKATPKKVVVPENADTTSHYSRILGMEYDGQISMLVPETEEKVEKQITGQISIQDALIEWERMKKENEQKRMAEVQQHILQQTGSMFTEFEAATRDGLLEKLEKGKTFGLEGLENTKEESEDTAETEVKVEEIEESEETDEVEELEEIEISEEPEEALSDKEEDLDEFDEEESGEELEEESLEESEEESEEEDLDEEESLQEESEEESLEESKEDESEEDSEEDDSAAQEPKESKDDMDDKDFFDEDFDEEESASEETDENDSFEGRKKIPANYHKVRRMTEEELKLFGSYAQNKTTRDQIVYALENVSMAAFTGNIILTGEEGMDKLTLAKKIIKEVQENDRNFSGKIAKISADSLNRKGVEEILSKVTNGALIIQKAGALSEESIEKMQKAMNQDSAGFIVILEDDRKVIHKLLKENPFLRDLFNIRIHVASLDNDSLVNYAKQYALDQEYSIDDMGVLALHTKISERQSSNHTVTVDEVREIVDSAIKKANRKTLGHFFDIIVAKRYDEEDMIILREKDFR